MFDIYPLISLILKFFSGKEYRRDDQLLINEYLPNLPWSPPTRYPVPIGCLPGTDRQIVDRESLSGTGQGEADRKEKKGTQYFEASAQTCELSRYCNSSGCLRKKIDF